MKSTNIDIRKLELSNKFFSKTSILTSFFFFAIVVLDLYLLGHYKIVRIIYAIYFLLGIHHLFNAIYFRVDLERKRIFLLESLAWFFFIVLQIYIIISLDHYKIRSIIASVFGLYSLVYFLKLHLRYEKFLINENSVNIFFAGDDCEDEKFATKIFEKLVKQYNIEPKKFDVDEFHRQDISSVNRQIQFRGIPVYVLSKHMLSKDYNRNNLIKSYPAIGLPGCQAFYISRDKSPSEFLNEYPDLKYIFDNVMIGYQKDNKTNIEKMIAELVKYKENYRTDREQITKESFRFKRILYEIITVLGMITPILYQISLFALIALTYILIKSPPINNFVVNGLVYLICFGIGYGINRFPALDLWPWLGRRWEFDKSNFPDNFYGYADEKTNMKWFEKDCSFNNFKSHSKCSESELNMITQLWLGVVYRTIGKQLIRIIYMSIPTILVLIRIHSFWINYLTAIILIFCGLYFPTLDFWAYNKNTKKVAFWRVGLTEKETKRTDKWFSFLHGGLETELDYTLGQSIFSWSKQHPLVPERDYIFISYAWEDEKENHNAESLSKTLDKLKVNYFFDTNYIKNKFIGWRWQISLKLLKCTHYFIVLGPKTLEGCTVRKEIKTIFQRWYTELYPSIICVIEPEVAKNLMKKNDLPSEIRFILTYCPHLSSKDIKDQNKVFHVIKQRRRQGLYRDIKATLVPKYTLRQMLSNLC